MEPKPASVRDSLHPGPKDLSLLRLQNQHISSHVWLGQERLLRLRNNYVRGAKPQESVLAMLKMAGFGYVAQIEKFNVDSNLINALVERWRPETCTFHLPHGECTVTLEDVALQLGVPIDGDAVTTAPVVEWSSLCRELLGAVPPVNAWDGQTVELSWFATKFAELPANASRIVIEQYTRAYIMRLIGGLLMPEKLGARVHLKYLPLLKDLSTVARYSWGSAILACLYRELCHATKKNCTEIGGCLVLLQAWAWDRIPHVAPKVGRLSDDQVHRGLGFPLARRWSRRNNTPNHALRYYRISLDRLDSRQFIWTPYASPDVKHCIPQDPGDVCYAMVPLICFAIVEWHHPDRVVRQFGLRQSIPLPPTNMDRLREVNMRGQEVVYLPKEHMTLINFWRQRRERLIQGRPFHGYLDDDSDYMKWYLHVTRRWISREGAFFGAFVFGLHRILRFAASEIPTTRIDNINGTCNDMLNVLQQYYPSFFSPVPGAAPPAQEFPRPCDAGNVSQKQPLPMGFASYPSSSHHAPYTAGFASSHPHSASIHASTSQYPAEFQQFYTNMGAPPPMFGTLPAHAGITISAPAGGVHPYAVGQQSMPPLHRPSMPFTETEDEDESKDDLETEDNSDW